MSAVGWEVREPVANEEQHILPLGDLVEHTATECICEPRTEPVPRDDGSMGWVIVHHSLDGREFREPDHTGSRPPAG